MYAARKHSNNVMDALISSLILVPVLISGARLTLASEEPPNEAGAKILVLEDCDSDNKLSTDPYGDTISLLNSKCELIKKFRSLSIHNVSFIGPRNISVSEDGRFYIVCQIMPGRLTMYETANCRELWTLWIDFESAVFANNSIYAVNRNNVFTIDNTGTIVKHARLGGFDIAVDTKHDCLWIVGDDVKKFDLDLRLNFKTKLTLDNNKTGAFSVDFDPLGSIWIAERNFDYRRDSKNRLVKRSLYGDILKIVDLDFSPVRVRIDSSDGSVWTTGIIKELDFSRFSDDLPETLDVLNELVTTKTEVFTCKYDSEGNWIFVTSKGGYSIELDQSDGSAWIAGRENIWHYSANDRPLAAYTGSSDCQKWLAIIPDNSN
jgi:hypothetical protein